MKKLKGNLITGPDYFINLMYQISLFIVVIVGIMITVVVFLRYFFSFAVGWSTEITEYLLFIIVMLATPWVLKNDAHIQLDFFINSLNPRFKKRVLSFDYLFGALFCLFFFYQGLLVTYISYVEGIKVQGVLLIDRYLIICFVPVMSAFCFYQFLLKRKGLRNN